MADDDDLAPLAMFMKVHALAGDRGFYGDSAMTMVASRSTCSHHPRPSHLLKPRVAGADLSHAAAALLLSFTKAE